MTAVRSLALVILVLTEAGCASTIEHDRMYPLLVPIVDGRPLHPSTGKPINCELMAPFEERFDAYRKHKPAFAEYRYPWFFPTLEEIGGARGYWLGVNSEQMSQGVAMSRACREAAAKANAYKPAPVWE